MGRIWKNLREKKKYLQNMSYIIIFQLKKCKLLVPERSLSPE